MATFVCPECRMLFESLISQIDMDEVKFEATHGLADEVQCLRCGNLKPGVWNRETGRCPRCGEKMVYEVTGRIRVKF